MRVGTAAVTTRGMKEAEMAKIVDFINHVLTHHDDDGVIQETKKAINNWMGDFPLYSNPKS